MKKILYILIIIAIIVIGFLYVHNRLLNVITLDGQHNITDNHDYKLNFIKATKIDYGSGENQIGSLPKNSCCGASVSTSIAVGSDNNAYIVDGVNQKIIKIDELNNTIKTFVTGIGTDIAFDNSGNMYASESIGGFKSIGKYDKTGKKIDSLGQSKKLSTTILPENYTLYVMDDVIMATVGGSYYQFGKTSEPLNEKNILAIPEDDNHSGKYTINSFTDKNGNTYTNNGNFISVINSTGGNIGNISIEPQQALDFEYYPIKTVAFGVNGDIYITKEKADGMEIEHWRVQ